MAGGIGRFARKKALSQGDAAAAPAPAAGGGVPGGGGVATPAENANGKMNDAAAPAPAPAAGERPSTAFASLGSDRPATSGSHGFSNIGAFFGAEEEDDEAMMDAAGGDDVGGAEFFSATPIEGMDDGDFGGFAGFGGFGDVEEQPAAGGVANEATASDAAKPPAAAPPVAGVGGAGIGLFAKKRAAAAAAALAPAATTAPAEQAAPTKDVAMSAPADKNAGGGVAASTAGSSVANLSVFDTDLVSKGTENATSPKDAVVDANIEQGVGGGNVKDAAMEEVPKTIPTSGDDVEDDLTEATVATAFAFEAPREDVSMTEGAKDAEPSATSKTSPYFANPAAARGHVEENKAASPPVDSVMTEAVPGSPPGEEIVIPGITTNVAPPATAGHSSPEGAFEKPAPKPASKPSSGTTLSPRQASSTQRVSLSPTPGAITNRAASFSPKPGRNTNSPKGAVGGMGLDQNGLVIPGMANAVVANATVEVAQPAPAPPMKGPANTAGASVGTGTALSPHRAPTQRVSLSPRPGVDGGAKDATAFSPKGSGVDASMADNGIVIPGVPAAVANAQTNVATAAVANQQFGLGGAKCSNPASNVGGGSNQFARSGQSNSTSRVSSFLLRKSTTSSTNPKAPVPNVRPSIAGNSGCIGKFSSNVNGVETAKFAMPAEAPPATNTPVPATAGQFNAQANVTATPFARGGAKNQSTVTPTPGTATAPAPTQTYNRVVPGMPTTVAEPKAMEVEQPRLDDLTEAPPQQRPRSQTIFEYKSPPPPAKSPESSVTPKASNVHNNAAVVVTAEKNRAASYPAVAANQNSAFRTDENFDTLLEQFQQDIQHSTDIHEKGGNDLLELECELAHVETEILGFRDEYLSLLDELEHITAIADEVIAAESDAH